MGESENWRMEVSRVLESREDFIILKVTGQETENSIEWESLEDWIQRGPENETVEGSGTERTGVWEI